MTDKTTIITNAKCWMEHTAITQLKTIAQLQGVIRAIGLPDLHPGQIPVGMVVETQKRLYPHLIGNDIGCGMELFETNCTLRKFKQNRFVTKLNHIRALEDLPTQNPYLEESPIFNLGTLGSGNHFAEFQTIEQVIDERAFALLNIPTNKLLLLIHSGSRGYGQQILNRFKIYNGLASDSLAAAEYLTLHNDALFWARRNRLLVAKKLMAHLGYATHLRTLLDCHHNFVEQNEDKFLHRKGAVSTQQGPVVIPGSRGSLTYLVLPAEETEISAHSLSHGAGRKWARSLCKSRIKEKYDKDSIRQTRLGSRTICHNTNLLYQEAPEAYKNIDNVIEALLEHGLCTIIATLRPLITYKDKD